MVHSRVSAVPASFMASSTPPAARLAGSAGRNRYSAELPASSVSYTNPVAGSVAVASWEKRPMAVSGTASDGPSDGTSKM